MSIFSGPDSSSKAMSKADIEWLLNQAFAGNRTDKQGLFGGYQWTQDDDGRWTQTETVNDAMLPGIERLFSSISNPSRYESPSQFGSMMEAIMARRPGGSGGASGGGSMQPGGPQPQGQYQPPVVPPSNFQNQGSGEQVGQTRSGGGLSGQGTGGGRVGYPEGQQAGLSGGQMRGSGPGYTGGFSPDGSGLPGGQFGGGVMGGGSGGGWGGMGDTYNATDFEKLFGRKDIGSLGQLNLSENGGRIGQIASLLTGVPGLGLLGKWAGNRNIDNKTWMSPVDPNDPYGTNDDPTGLFTREQLPNSPMLPQERGWSGRQQAYDPRGSITGGGAFNYATRLKLPPIYTAGQG